MFRLHPCRKCGMRGFALKLLLLCNDPSVQPTERVLVRNLCMVGLNAVASSQICGMDKWRLKKRPGRKSFALLSSGLVRQGSTLQSSTRNYLGILVYVEQQCLSYMCPSKTWRGDDTRISDDNHLYPGLRDRGRRKGTLFHIVKRGWTEVQ
ncbi:hypothetical protein F5Y12DRAFT_731198 [Xylaria sp. FL1777]|nr:hypothetical protein F5Y12DRAFT_731198 [Xylaria sp. FL1777]